ncbi:hypothetical protein NW759_009560 [Fusarium solani]|nr:hypothetical protein NW759_009560 [Fusarium solani]
MPWFPESGTAAIEHGVVRQACQHCSDAFHVWWDFQNEKLKFGPPRQGPQAYHSSHGQRAAFDGIDIQGNGNNVGSK